MLPYRLPIEIQHKGNRNKRDTQKSKRATSPRHPKILIHGTRKEGETSTEARTHEIITGKDRRGVIRIRVAQVVQDGVEEQERADGEEGRADYRHDPMHGRPRCPAEPEQADGDAEGADHGGREALLGFDLAVGVELWFLDEIQV